MEDMFSKIVFLKHACFFVLGFMGMEGQESGKIILGSIFLLLVGLHFKWSSSTN
jgi:hypothetical protein